MNQGPGYPGGPYGPPPGPPYGGPGYPHSPPPGAPPGPPPPGYPPAYGPPPPNHVGVPDHRRVAPSSGSTLFFERLIRVLIINVIVVVAATVIGLMVASYQSVGTSAIHFDQDQGVTEGAEDATPDETDDASPDVAPIDDPAVGDGAINSISDALTALRTKSHSSDEVVAYLNSVEVDDTRRGEVSSTLANYLADNSATLSDASEQNLVAAIEAWNSPQAASGLIRALDGVSSGTKAQILPALAATNTNEAAETIAGYLGQGTLGAIAADSLRIMGPMALPAIQPYTDSPIYSKKVQAQKLVAELGGAVDEGELDARLEQLRDPSFAVRRRAAVWFLVAPIAAERRDEVAQALRDALQSADYLGQPNLEQALARWDTNSSLPGTSPSGKVESLETLVERGDDASLKAIAAMLGGTQGDKAVAALLTFGDKAKPHVLPYYNDTNPFVRQKARSLLTSLNVTPSEITAQSIKDLSATDALKVRAAADWLGTAEVEPELQALAVDQLLARLGRSSVPLPAVDPGFAGDPGVGPFGFDPADPVDPAPIDPADDPAFSDPAFDDPAGSPGSGGGVSSSVATKSLQLALARWATPGEWQELYNLLNQSDPVLVGPAVKTLVSITEPTVTVQLTPLLTPKLASLLTSTTTQRQAHAGMVAAGKDGEDAALALLDPRYDPIVIVAATDVLRQVGTQKSIARLNQLEGWARRNRAAPMIKAASDAQAAIRKRMRESDE